MIIHIPEVFIFIRYSAEIQNGNGERYNFPRLQDSFCSASSSLTSRAKFLIPFGVNNKKIRKLGN